MALVQSSASPTATFAIATSATSDCGSFSFLCLGGERVGKWLGVQLERGAEMQGPEPRYRGDHNVERK